ncbi:Membrane protein insertase YidC [Polystyrenella longa]|uniref:Membrane protein insertase YidC n=1 Tax=Polystyrenella longa TaxID=2528007 RepID=A0A518CQ95_9PLAN|nr:YidC/Oxa1 family insertase periplasmic-domain containing protein [Polystyrenella longa]QDU81399.1 Membrane protein insertase YidC [Polystyrenella longa]
MDDRNLVRFIIASAIVTFFWFIVGPKLGLVPQPKPPKKAPQQINAPVADEAQVDADKAVVDGAASKEAAGDASTANDKATGESEDGTLAEADSVSAAEPEDAPEKKELEKYPNRKVVLGTLETETPYYMQVELNTQGATVEGAWLNDPRYMNLEDTSEPLRLLGANPDVARRSFEVSIKEVDDLLAGYNTSLTKVDWKVTKEVKDDKLDILKEVVFQYPVPDGSLVLEKRYWLEAVTTQDGIEPYSHETRDSRPEGYLLRYELKIHNQQQQAKTVQYRMLGPVGVPLENKIATYKWRDIKFQSEVEENDFEGTTISATEIIDKDEKPGPWTNYLRFVGVDVQYFAALVFIDDSRPYAERTQERWLKQVEPIALTENKDKAQFSDISFSMLSTEDQLKADGELVHQYKVYLGPKRDDLLEPLNADYVMEVWSWISWLSKPMMWLLTRMHESLGFPYWLAIICLTIIVRGVLHPITRKQMASAKRMKELQPKLQELKKKHGDNREKMAQAQMELYREHNFNPFAGCLPVFMQMPIFIALYQGLRSTIDLRLAEFLWIDNLAAPDMLYTLGIQNLPFLGDYFYYFNLLPVITVLLFIVQNKILMPQPDPTDEMAVQTQKMMKFMMVFMGFMFYHVPSGLCVYFITSSIWSLCERKMIDFQHTPKPTDVLDESPSTIRPHKKQDLITRNGDQKPEKDPGKVGGLWKRVLEAAEAKQQLQRDSDKSSKINDPYGKKKKKKR